METVEDVIIVGAGIAGLTTALGLHRKGLRSLVLESSSSLRVSGYALVTWTNAWKALDTIGIGDQLRQTHLQLQRFVSVSSVTGVTTGEASFAGRGKNGNHEVRCVRRHMLVEALEKELPKGTIRFESKVVSIEEDGYLKVVHLADGAVFKTKVLLGCDGVNSVVSNWLGFRRPVLSGRSAIRGCVELPYVHGLKPQYLLFSGDGIRCGFVPCSDKTVYWFFTYTNSSQCDHVEDPLMIKKFILSKLHKAPKEVTDLFEYTRPEAFISFPLRFRLPWNVLWGNICKGSVCVAGDAFHPMTPDIGQGACSALEDGVVLARCLREALLGGPRDGGQGDYDRIKRGLEKYAKERRWRAFELISTAYLVGLVQQSDGAVMNFLRDKFLSKILSGILLKKADYGIGKLYSD